MWLLIALGCALLAAVALYGQSIGTVPWLLVIVIASAAALFALRSILRGAQEPEPFGPGNPLPGERSGELRGFGETLDRARSGYPYSQAIVAARVASAFLEKVRLTRGLSPLEMERVRADRGVLLDLIGEPELADFVIAYERYGREFTKDPEAAMADKSFGAALSQVLEAMEAWP